jgi:L-lactate dehydrogenase (cytochrome)
VPTVFDQPQRSRVRVTERRMPRWQELRELIQVESPRLRHARLDRAHSIEDLRSMASRRAPRAVFDYVDGGAGDERSMARAREAFDRVEFHPNVLRDVSQVSPSTTILGETAALPVVLAPTGFTRLAHCDGERAVAPAAARAGIPLVLSTVGTISPEEFSRIEPHGERWFQLYLWRDRGRTAALLDRVAEAGLRTLVLTVDVPVPGDRRRDARNGLGIPPALRLNTLAEGALHPRWWFDFLTTEPIRFAIQSGPNEHLRDALTRAFDPAVTFQDLAWLRERWQGPLIVKGVMRADDARQIAALGADGIVVSNHGGRQLDRSVTPLDLLRPVVHATDGSLPVFVDGGIRSGADVVAAIGLGAHAVLVGRAYLYGLMAAGEPGVDRALAILRDDIIRSMTLLGVTALSELNDSLVTLRPGGDWTPREGS